MAASLTPTIIVLALGAGALGFPDALRLLLRDVAGRSPLLDLAIYAFAMAVLTAYGLGAVMLACFVRKAGAGAGGHAQLTDTFARLTLAVSLGASALVLACLLLADGLALLCRRILDVVVGESQSPAVVPLLVASASAAAAVIACCTKRRALLRAAPASSPTSRLSVTAQPASYKGHGRGNHTSGTAPRESVGTSMGMAAVGTSMAAEALTPRVIVLALGAGALGFPDALRLLLRDVAGRSPILDIAVCAVAMAALTAYALGTVLLTRFVLKASPGAGAGGHAPAPRARRTDPFARLTLAVALGAAVAVLACLIAEPGARGLALLCRLIVHDVAGESEPSHVVVSVLVAIAAVLLPCCITTRRLLLRGFRGEDGAAPASTPTARLSMTTKSAVAAFLLVVVAVTGGLYAHRGGSLVAVAAAVVGASVIISRFTRNAADAGGRAALAPATTTTRRSEAPSQLRVVVSFAILVCLLLVVVVTTYTTHGREANGAEF